MTSSTQPARLLTIDESVALQEATDPRVSPDGRLVAFCAGAVSKKKKHARGAIHLVPSDGSAPPRRLTAGTALDNAPRWSPDGYCLAFISDRHERGKPGVYTIPLDGGEAERLVTERGEASDPQWSPDGRHIAFLLKEVDSPETEKRKKKLDDAIVVDDDKFTRLWVVDIQSRVARRLSPDGMNVLMHTWAPDGARIAFLHAPTPKVNDSYNKQTLSTLTVPATGEEAPIVSAVCRLYGDVAALCWSPDGTRLACVAGENQRPNTPGADKPVVIEATAGHAAKGGPALGEPAQDEPRVLLAGHPAQISWVAWLSDSDLAAAGVEGLRGAYYRLPLHGGEAAALFPGGQPAHVSAALGSPEAGLAACGSPRQFALSADRATLAFTLENTTSPGDVWAVRAGRDPIRLTTLNPYLEEMAWGAVEEVSWTAPDGLEIGGLLIKPVGYEPGRHYPTVVHVHGGPTWLWSDRFYAGWHDWGQLLAGRGYAVLLPNPRGSTGRGSTYVAANFADVGGGEWQDVLAGAHWAIDSGIADAERMGIGGWSWGGYLTAWAVTQTDLFKAAVVGAGVTNLLSDHGQNDVPDMNLLLFRDLPYDDAAPYWDASPMKYIARVHTPTLILHGEKDERVTPAQAQEFYRGLKTHGVPTQFVLYPREGHPITERKHQRDLLTRVLAWFDHHLKGVASSQ